MLPSVAMLPSPFVEKVDFPTASAQCVAVLESPHKAVARSAVNAARTRIPDEIAQPAPATARASCARVGIASLSREKKEL